VDSDVESLAHNIQIGAPRCQIRQGSPKRQNGGSARVIPGKIQLHSVRRSVRLHGEPGARKRRLSMASAERREQKPNYAQPAMAWQRQACD